MAIIRTDDQIAPRAVADLFNPMATDYDDLQDFWYNWLFSRLHFLLAATVRNHVDRAGVQCLDVGCGTGFQSVLLAAMGHPVIGLDIAEALVRVAASKKPADLISRPVFEPAFDFADSYAQSLRRQIAEYRGTAPVGALRFIVADAVMLPFRSESFGLINCSGSTLNFVEDYSAALEEMCRVLMPGGVLFLEVENRFNLDLLWALIDSLTGGRVGYDQTLKESWYNFSAPISSHVKIEYPLTEHSGTTYLPMRLFSLKRLCAEIANFNMSVEAVHSIHSITNLLPSTLLDSPSPSSIVTRAATALAAIESTIGSWPIIRQLGCSAVLVAVKKR
jgi:ubiquinone/menaquinone biosynthesis C-methylase UbiE